MTRIIEATFKDGVFKPDDQPGLCENTRVRLRVETLEDETGEADRQQAWASLEQLWRQSTFDSHGDRLTRDQLHERR